MRLLTGKHHDNTLMPELIGVFRAVTKYPPLSIADQVYYNSWFLVGLFHHRDANTHIALRNRPKLIPVANHLMEYALSTDTLYDTNSLSKAELTSALQQQVALLRFFAKKLDEFPGDIPSATLSLAQTAVLFNQHVLHQREEFYKDPDDDHSELRRRLSPDVNPFVQVYAAVHLMDLIGRRLGETYRAPDKATPFRQFTTIMRAREVPLKADVHMVEEKTIHAAVTVLRDLNHRLQEMLERPRDYLPGTGLPENRLVEQLFMLSRGYREPAAHAAGMPEQDGPATPSPADGSNVIPLFPRPGGGGLHHRHG